MLISGTNISTLGLKLIKLEGYYDLPARKKVLTEPLNAAKEIVFQPKVATVTLLGKYADVATMLTALNSFETLLKSQLKHAIVIANHGLSFTGVFASGYEVTSYYGGRIVKVVAQINVTDN